MCTKLHAGHKIQQCVSGVETVEVILIFCQTEWHILNRPLQPSNLRFSGRITSCGLVLPFFRSHAHTRMFCSNVIGTCRFKNNFQDELRQLCQAKKCVVWGDIHIQEAFVLSTQHSAGSCGKGGFEATSFSLSLKSTKLLDPFFPGACRDPSHKTRTKAAQQPLQRYTSSSLVGRLLSCSVLSAALHERSESSTKTLCARL